MKQLLFLLIFISSTTIAQCDTTNVVKFPDVEAQFPGGAAKMKQFIQKNMVYPDNVDDLIDASRVHLEFNVCKDGSLFNIRCLRPKNDELKKAYIESVSKMPNWIPAEVDGKPVTSRCRLPITICFN
ncbi:MAG: energy transducer TonB [Crocinitomicaceae bacterium]